MEMIVSESCRRNAYLNRIEKSKHKSTSTENKKHKIWKKEKAKAITQLLKPQNKRKSPNTTARTVAEEMEIMTIAHPL